MGQESFYPFFSFTLIRLVIVPTRHRQQVTNSHGHQVVTDLIREFVGKETYDLVCEVQPTLCDGKADSSSGKRLANGVENMGNVRSTLALPMTVDYSTILNNHHTMDIQFGLGSGTKERIHRRRNLFRCLCTRQVNTLITLRLSLADCQYHQQTACKK